MCLDYSTYNKVYGGNEDIIYVKFNKQIKTYDGAANSGATTNYTVNGYTIPSTSKIDSGVKGYNDKANTKNYYTDIVAIHLTKGTLLDNSNTINISNTLESVSGARLENGGLKLLTKVTSGALAGIFTCDYNDFMADTDPTIRLFLDIRCKCFKT